MLELATPSLLFSAISLILLAQTNRFLSYASLVRTLTYENGLNQKEQIKNLRKRLGLIKTMQILGVSSLLLCLGSMLFIYCSMTAFAEILFVIAVILLIFSLAITIWEINISIKALELHLDTAEQKKKQ